MAPIKSNLKEWLKDNNRISVDDGSIQCTLKGSAYITSLLKSIAAHFNHRDHNPHSILKKICCHAKEMEEYYSAFLSQSEKEFFAMIEEFRCTGEYCNFVGYPKAIFRLVENTFDEDLVVVNSEDLHLVYGVERYVTKSDTIVLIYDPALSCFRGTRKVVLENWLKSHHRKQVEEHEEWSSKSHHAYENCFLQSVALHYNTPDVDPLSLMKKICSHARNMACYYSVFLEGGTKEFLSMIDHFETNGEEDEILLHMDAVIIIAGNALQTNIVVVDDNASVIYGEEEQPITPDTIVLIDQYSENSFSGTQLVEDSKSLECTTDTEDLLQRALM